MNIFFPQCVFNSVHQQYVNIVRQFMNVKKESASVSFRSIRN